MDSFRCQAETCSEDFGKENHIGCLSDEGMRAEDEEEASIILLSEVHLYCFDMSLTRTRPNPPHFENVMRSAGKMMKLTTSKLCC